jgi:hypothetical protein
MKKILGLYITLILFYACNTNVEKVKIEEKQTSQYNIETILYWDISNTERDTILFKAVRVDTINHIGSSEYYSDNGTLMERIVIIDKEKAFKINYDHDTISRSKICWYKLRKDYPTKNYYSIITSW